ncbi:unnamed protein product [Heligmosomoides polygyrus]|uniref:Uncharacterized protein n=1 Tax=Heligmosomoides polygyrus TaxID=6339 RepID=A0A3P7TXD5_HELPZ|nr:unnamed protein product [Heligmosomoides polygyrus]
MADPVVTIYYVSPYRRFVKRCIFGVKATNSETTALKQGSYENASTFPKSFVSLSQLAEFKNRAVV